MTLELSLLTDISVSFSDPSQLKTVRRINKKDYSNKGQFLEDEVANEEVLLRAMSLLDHMEHEMQIAPDSYTFSILLNAWVQHIRPGNEAAADKAEALLKRNVQDSYISTSSQTVDEDSIWPNVKHYSSVLKAHAKTKSAGVSLTSSIFDENVVASFSN